MRLQLTILALVGCASPSGGGKSSPVVDTGGPALPEVEASTATPSWTAEDVGARLSDALSVPPLGGDALFAYLDLMSRGDEECPGNVHHITDTWLHGCTASTGYSYAGVSEYFEDPVGEPFPATVYGVAGDFWIITPEGSLFEAGGHAVEVAGDALWVSEVAGSWLWEDGPGWLASGFSGTLVLEKVEGIHARVHGAAQVQGTSWSANELILGPSCGLLPMSGRLGLRDPSGGWYTLPLERCDPCGTVSFEGEVLGEACVDFTGLHAILEER